ncbi:uncharacterized protein LOC114828614 [Galendromus occidentalis]|uniref:Uncharacterized protein LOC114828614 n=1 Tax=Galendromus occidentalis TaxID=34638 RepID=A0AAJ7WJD4_9ACAR|nr:uncharacterized protein LOC114828614 [Galendromus occidentalis]
MSRVNWLARWPPSCPRLRLPSLKGFECGRFFKCSRLPTFKKLFEFRKPTWVIVFQLLFAEATLPGLRNVFGFGPPIPRLLFAVAFVYLVFETVADVEEHVENYLEYNTTLQVTIEEPRSAYMMMPEVTVCNKNPIYTSSFCKAENRHRIETETNKTCKTSNCETFISLYYQNLCSGEDSERERYRIVFGTRNNDEGRKANKYFYEWHGNLMSFEKGRELLSLLSYPDPGSLISMCLFNNKDCFSKFRKNLQPSYGMCYSLFAEGEEPVVQFETHLNGLMLNLNVLEYEYLPMLTTVGHVIMIHSPEEKINAAEDAVFVHPRATTYIGLQKEQVVRLPPPSRDPCTETYPPELLQYLEPELKKVYTTLVCRELCTQIAVLEACKCIDFRFIRPANVASVECSYVIPSQGQESSLTCAIEVTKNIEKNPLRCGCYSACVEDQYIKTNSALFWHPRLQKDVGNASTSTVYVYMHSNKIHVRRKVMQTSWKDLLNSIAGTMGLYLGYSYLFAFYIVDILIRGILEIVSWKIFKRNQNRRKYDEKIRRNLIFDTQYH